MRLLPPFVTPPPEPRRSTYESMGRLCAAWSNLEGISEMTLWGILDIKADQKVGDILSSRLGLEDRWNFIVDYSVERHSEEEQRMLREIRKRIKEIAFDRNIIVHGLTHGQYNPAKPYD